MNDVERRPVYAHSYGRFSVQIDVQVHEYGRNTDTTHGLPECVSVYGIKSRLQVHKRDVQRLLEFSMTSGDLERSRS